MMSEIQLNKYNSEEIDLWDEFVKQSNNGTLFHRQDFLNYHQQRFDQNAHHLMFRKKGNLIGVLPMGFFEEEGALIAKSPMGASYGGLVTKAECTLVEMEQMVDLLVKYLKHHNVQRFHVVLSPAIYQKDPMDYFEFCLIKNNAVIAPSDLTSYIEAKPDQMDHFEARARRDTQKAVDAGLSFREHDDVEGFYEILAENMKKFDGTPTHSQEEAKWLIKNLPHDIKLFGVESKGNAIAGALIFKGSPQALLVFYWAQRQDSTQLHPKNFLIINLAEYALSQNVRFIDFGPHTLNMEPFYGVTMFKESLGGHGMLRRSYQLTL